MDEKQIISRILDEGDTRCFTLIVERYSGMVYSKALGVVRCEELAAEVAQQTFIKAYERLRCFRGQNLGPWLVSIAYHTALNMADSERRRRKLTVGNADEADDDGYSEEREELLLRMEKALDELPEEDKEIVTQHYMKNRSTKEIAQKTGLSQSNVLVKLHRIREKLRQKLMQ